MPLSSTPTLATTVALVAAEAAGIEAHLILNKTDVTELLQKALDKAATGGDKAAPAELFKNAQSVIDSIADKGIFHKNKAARDKSRLSAKVKTLALAAA